MYDQRTCVCQTKSNFLTHVQCVQSVSDASTPLVMGEKILTPFYNQPEHCANDLQHFRTRYPISTLGDPYGCQIIRRGKYRLQKKI